jgi:hypothetical protein
LSNAINFVQNGKIAISILENETNIEVKFTIMVKSLKKKMLKDFDKFYQSRNQNIKETSRKRFRISHLQTNYRTP